VSYELKLVGSPTCMLRLTVWEMSKIRDRMLKCDAVSRVSFKTELGDGARPAGRGIPIYKLTSIDGWRVSVKEIDGSLEAIRTKGVEDDGDELWEHWLRFLRAARCAKGFVLESS
jgi:hypothetical protein